MSENIHISLFEVVGSPFCVSTDAGQKIYNLLDTALKADQDVSLSFDNVTALTAAFLSTAVGQLYGAFDEEKIQTLLKVEDAEPRDLALLDRVICKNNGFTLITNDNDFKTQEIPILTANPSLLTTYSRS